MTNPLSRVLWMRATRHASPPRHATRPSLASWLVLLMLCSWEPSFAAANDETALGQVRQACQQQLERGDYEAAADTCRAWQNLNEKLQNWPPEDAAARSAILHADSVLTGRRCSAEIERMELKRALPTCRDYLKLTEQRLPASWALNAAWVKLADLYLELGELEPAEQLLLRSQQLATRLGGPSHPELCFTLDSLARVDAALGRLDRAFSKAERSLMIREAGLGISNLATLQSVDLLMQFARWQGRTERMALLLQRVERLLTNAMNSGMVITPSNLAWRDRAQSTLSQLRGERVEATALLRRALERHEAQVGRANAHYAWLLLWFAEATEEQGLYLQADALYQQCAEAFERIYGSGSYHVGKALVGRARCLNSRGEEKQSEQLALRALAIFDAKVGPLHNATRQVLVVLADLYKQQEDFAKAEAYLLRALELARKSTGPNSPSSLWVLQHLAGLSTSQRRYKQAEQYWRRVLTHSESDKHHLNAVGAHVELGFLHYRQGNYALAQAAYAEAQSILNRERGLVWTGTEGLRRRLAWLRVATGQFDEAAANLQELLEADERRLRRLASDAQITAFLERSRWSEHDIYSLLRLPGMSGPVRLRTLQLAMTTALLRKGRSGEAELLLNATLRRIGRTAEHRQRYARWQFLRAERERLLLRGMTGPQQERFSTELADFDLRIEELQNQLLGDIRQTLPDALTLPQSSDITRFVATGLPAGSALLELLRFYPRRFAPKLDEGLHEEARYVALLLFPDQSLDAVDLGSAQEIDSAASAFLSQLRQPQTDPKPAAQAMYQRLLVPLLGHLRSSSRLYVAADGVLNLIPLSALHDGKQYLVDSKLTLVYLTSGRDLLRQSVATPHEQALILADPDFAFQLQVTTPARASTGGAVAVGSAAASEPSGLAAEQSGEAVRSWIANLRQIPRLPGARREGESIHSLLSVPVHSDSAASEARVRSARSPQILHIATHGVFIDTNSAPPDPSGERALVSLFGPTQAPPGAQADETTMTRSALLLAGASHAADAGNDRDDGILTAEEVRRLELSGTQLVVLSACDTGQGVVKDGQGVYGLRRAFFVAGAGTIVMSLWPVADGETQSLMQTYYSLLLDRKAKWGRIAALSQAMRTIKKKRPHPYYWAPFIGLGQDAPLSLE